MTELDDHDLLAEYTHNRSETAFAALVARYVSLVHSTARRFTGNPHHAEEITQAVFVILARKASSFRRGTVLSGWLYQATRLTAANFVKGEIRRQNREQEAYMQSTTNEPEAAAWQQIAPLLDEAMGRLGDADRNAVVLRFFENKSAQEVATKLNVTEAAAHKRVNRAVERLRKFFSKRGVTLTATLLAGAVAANSVQAAPAALAATASATAAQGTAISATLTTLINTTMKTMTWMKLKFAAGVGIAALLAGGTATVVISQTGGSGDNNLTPQEILQKAQNRYASLTSYRDDGKTVATVNGMTVTTTFNIKLSRPDLYRIEWAQPVHPSYTNTGVVWSAGQGDFLEMGNGSPVQQTGREMAIGGATGISGGAAATIPGTFFKQNWGNQLGGAASDEKRQADAKVGGEDCYVLASESKGRTRTLWIGKTDFLIHQVRTVTSPEALKAALDQAAKVNSNIPIRLPESQGITSTETHSNILVNQTLGPADFAR